MTGEEPRGERWDFFISYTQADQRWAEWIAWVLEEHGHYKVLVQAWDFVPGSNWVQDMQAGVRDAARTIAVLSEAYLDSEYGSAEWQAAWVSDPGGARRRLLTARVAESARPGLLAGVVGVDLFGVDEDTAQDRVLGMVSAAIKGRAKPASQPPFPGTGRAVADEPQFPGLLPGNTPPVQEPVGRARQAPRNYAGEEARALPLVGQVTDRAVLGIHPAIELPSDADPSLPNDLPLYIPRDIDPDLRAWIARHQHTGGFLLLTGPAAAGKTRTAYQLIHATLPDWPLLMPANAEQLTADIHRAPAERLVVWLNETQNYLGPAGLTAASVRHILSSPPPVIIIGTIWPDQYDTLTALPALGSASTADATTAPDLNRDTREILTILADRKDLPAGLTRAEQSRAEGLASRDPRIAEALTHADTATLFETLAAAPDLISRWLTAADPYGGAVITAAVTARRCGHPQPLPPGILQPLAQAALTPAQRARATSDWFPAAVHWAREQLRGQAAPLTPQATVPGDIDGDNVSDILVQLATRNPDTPWHYIPDATWLLLIDNATPQACFGIADTAYPNRHAHRAPITERALRKAADAGSLDAMFMLGLASQLPTETRQAEHWYRKAAADGHTAAMYYLGFLLAEQGHTDEAEQWYRQAANAGHFGAMSNLAVLLNEQGHTDEAQQWHRRAAAAGQIIFTSRQKTPARDQADQAEQCYQQAIAGDAKAMHQLAYLLAKQGHADQAEQWYRRAIAAGHLEAMNNLGLLLAEQGRPEEAEYWFRKNASAGGSGAAPAMYNLGRLFQDQGRPGEAERCYRQAATMGHTAAMTKLGTLLARQGHIDEAEQWYRKAAAAGDPNAMNKLGDLLTEQGDAHQAERWYRKAAKPS
jgi:TPR repeat protein